jgi:uncharacterized protein (TIGR03435 family)
MNPKVIGIALLTVIGLAQSHDTGPVPAAQFEVASIKPNGSASPCDSLIRYLPGGRINANNVPLRSLIRSAYRVKDFQITGGSDWTSAARYDVIAKATQGTSQDQLPVVMQAILADRFKLIVHRETKELPVYALVAAKQGRKLSQSKGACVEPGSSIPPSAPGQPQLTFCGTMVMGVNGLNAEKIDVKQMANGLSGILGRNVTDKTGFSGTFDVHLQFARDEATAGLIAIRGSGCGPAQSALDPTEPSIFTALEEQLGLRLESTKGPVEILVIDHAETPSEN